MKTDTGSHYVWVAIMVDMMNPINFEVIATSPSQEVALQAAREALFSTLTGLGLPQVEVDHAVHAGRSERFITQIRLTPHRC